MTCRRLDRAQTAHLHALLDIAVGHRHYLPATRALDDLTAVLAGLRTRLTDEATRVRHTPVRP